MFSMRTDHSQYIKKTNFIFLTCHLLNVFHVFLYIFIKICFFLYVFQFSVHRQTVKDNFVILFTLWWVRQHSKQNKMWTQFRGHFVMDVSNGKLPYTLLLYRANINYDIPSFNLFLMLHFCAYLTFKEKFVSTSVKCQLFCHFVSFLKIIYVYIKFYFGWKCSTCLVKKINPLGTLST